MKCLAILLLAAVVAGTGFSGNFNRGFSGNFNRGFSGNFNRGFSGNFNRGFSGNFNRGFNQGGLRPDFTYGNSEYHFSFLHDGHQKYTWQGASSYCQRLGHGYTLVNIETPQENGLITDIIAKHDIHYIWTGGYRNGHRFHWTTGEPVRDIGAWSPTGGKGTRQPDNREGNEYCLAILNNVYQDGIKWHDVACHHRKPTICERTY